MPAKNIVKKYVAGGTYHVFDRGVRKENVFLDNQDYKFFRKITRQTKKKMRRRIIINVYCLIPNHYHFQIWQENERDISTFMKSVGIRYSMYMRRKYGFSGKTFESTYKASLLRSKEAIWLNRRYILENPVEAGLTDWPHVGTGDDL